MKNNRTLIAAALILIVSSFSAYGSWHGKNFVGASLNPAGLINELSIYRTIDLSDPDTFLLSEANIAIGTWLGITPVGLSTTLKVTYSPVLFFDAGIQAGYHIVWMYHSWAMLPADYGPDVLDSLDYGFEALPYVEPYCTLKGRVGRLTAVLSFSFEKFFHNEYWYYWFPEIVVKDGWVINWNSYLIFSINRNFSALLNGFYLYGTDSGDSRFSAGPGIVWHINKDSYLTVSSAYHFKELLYTGWKFMAGWTVPFSL